MTRSLMVVAGLVCIGLARPAPSWAVDLRVAVHVSESSSTAWPYLTWKSFHPNQFLKEALISDGTPFVEVSDAGIDAGALMDGASPRFPILFSLANEVISDSVAAKIRAYVQAGGWVYVGSSSWTRNPNGSLRLNAAGRPVFALGPEMGLSANGWIRIETVDKIFDDAMTSHLPFGVIEWQMPRQYSQLDLWTPHWVWSAVATAPSAATSLLVTPLVEKFQVSFSNPPTITGAPSASFMYGDVNGDQREDLVFRSGSSISVRLSTGQELRSSQGWSSWNTAYTAALADVNGDGRADLVGRSGNDVQVGLSTGTSFQPSTQWTLWSPSYDMQFADVDADGDADIIGRLIGSNDVQVGRSNGAAGGFQSSTRWTLWGASYSMQFADVDGDRDADIVGRHIGGNDVQVGLSNGVSGFAGSTHWTAWDPAYDLQLADVDGDRDADIVGRRLGPDDVRVGLSNGVSGFAASTEWSIWNSNFTMALADSNGDRRADLIGCKVGSAGPFDPGEVHIGLSAGVLHRSVKLATKNFGAGRFIYNAEMVPLAGYGGFANDNSEYKTIRTSIAQAFNQTSAVPLVTLAPWPFPNQAAMIFRHDHALAHDVHELEAAFSPGTPFGEYYLMPELANQVFACNQPNDYGNAAKVTEILNEGGLIGAHIINHVTLDSLNYADALAHINGTVSSIQTGTNQRMSPIFVAPVYLAVKKSSLLAIRDAGFLTTGEQGVGPFPHFSIDPDSPNSYVGTVLQLPVSEWPSFDNMERMSVDPENIVRAAALSYELGGLLNVYDHVGHDEYASGCQPAAPFPTKRVEQATKYLNYASTKPGIWKSNSLQIREWWLRRDTRSINATFSRPSSASIIDVTVTSGQPRAPTPFPESNLGLRIALDSLSRSQANTRIAVWINGVSQPLTTCGANPASPVAVCAGNDLLVKMGAAQTVHIELGN